jgi:hypothetical protein
MPIHSLRNDFLEQFTFYRATSDKKDSIKFSQMYFTHLYARQTKKVF